MGSPALSRLVAGPRRSRAAASTRCLLALLLLGAGVAPPAAATVRRAPIVVQGRLIVALERDAGMSATARLPRAGRVARVLPREHALVVRVPRRRARAALARWRHLPGVRHAERDVRFGLAGGCPRRARCELPDDPLAVDQWALRSAAGVDAARAWRIQPGTAATRIAIVDTGVDATHPDLAGRIAAHWTLPGNVQLDGIGHGTAVAGVAAATAGNGIGIAGVAHHAGIVAAKATDDRHGASDEIDCSALAEAIDAGVAAGAQVVNVSASGPWSCQLLDEAVARAWSAGALVVAAAGNANRSTPEYPAALPHVLAVAATDVDDARAPFSTYGPWVELAAPGAGILTTVPMAGSELGRAYARLDGTSFAAPIVAGAAALVWPTVRDENGDGRVNDEVRARLLATAARIPGSGRLWQAGRLDICRAVSAPDADVGRTTRSAARTSPRCARPRVAPRPAARRAARTRPRR